MDSREAMTDESAPRKDPPQELTPRSIERHLKRTGAMGIGAIALGALALGALAFGALAIGRLAVARGTFGSLRVGRLEVDELVIGGRNLVDALEGKATDRY